MFVSAISGLPSKNNIPSLQVLKERAERHLQESVDRAVVTVPTYFNTEQCLATMTAAHLAGIEGVCLLQVCPQKYLHVDHVAPNVSACGLCSYTYMT
jgi:hypothetical protein